MIQFIFTDEMKRFFPPSKRLHKKWQSIILENFKTITIFYNFNQI